MTKTLKNISSLFLLFTFVMVSLCGMAQERQIKKGDAAFANRNYVEAIEYYKAALPDVKRGYEPAIVQKLLYKIGDAYLEMNQFAKALPWLQDAAATGIFTEEIFMSYAHVLTLNHKIDEAKEIYQQVYKRTRSDIAFKKIKTLEEYDSDTPEFLNVNSGAGVNTQYAEFSPSRVDNSIVFATTKSSGRTALINNRTFQNYSDLYIASFDPLTNRWGEPKELSEKINTRKSEGVFTYSRVTGRGYYMQCLENKKECQILTTRRNLAGKWDAPEVLNVSVRGSVGHPAIAEDGQTLYFVSDMEGGYGGKDIWKVRRMDDNIWSVPVNLGSQINSEYDELFPTISGDTILFFASDRPEAFGGLDIFYAEITADKYSVPTHLQYPFNTLRDDFGMLLMLDGGLFSSNRDNIARSDDIFMFTGFPKVLTVKGVVRDKSSDSLVDNADLKINFDAHRNTLEAKEGAFMFRMGSGYGFQIEAASQGYKKYKKEFPLDFISKNLDGDTLRLTLFMVKDLPLGDISGKVTDRESEEPMPGEIVTLWQDKKHIGSSKTSIDGVYSFTDVMPDAKYQLKVSKEGYFSESRDLTLPKLTTTMTFNRITGYDTDFRLTRIQKEKEVVINNIFYDFNKASLRAESKVELDKLVSMLIETPHVVIQINSHTDARGSNGYNKRLSQRRAQTVVDYLTQHGISSDRLFARGFGETALLVKRAQTEAQHQLNRRTAFKVLEVKEELKPQQQSNATLKVVTTSPVVGSESVGSAANTGLSYRVQIVASSQRYGEEKFAHLLRNLPGTKLFVTPAGKVYKYEIGERSTYAQAVALRDLIVSLGQADCFITAYKENKKMRVKEALKIEKQ